MDEIYRELTEIFREVFDDDSLILRPQSTAADIEGWDSLKQIDILIAVQERFRLKVSSRDLDGLASVGALVEVIQRKRTV
jgi:acyl carrier protein